LKIYEDLPLSTKTTIALGGKAKYFIECETTEEIFQAIDFSRNKNLPFYILSGGSNIVFPDIDLKIVIINIQTKGVSKAENGNDVILECQSGENWDSLVEYCNSEGLAGIECLSGIPGYVGSTPIQNVGAYGQEVKDVIQSVRCIDIEKKELKIFSNEECEFDYRQSRFKGRDKGKYIITSVVLKFSKNKEPEIKYPELSKSIEINPQYNKSTEIKEKLSIIRNTVISIRKQKSMVIDPNVRNTKSCGSFFTNPILEADKFSKFISDNKNLNPPYYKFQQSFKIPAAWLIEKSGFYKGYRYKGVGISNNHTLALVNYEGTSEQLMEFSSKIIDAVEDKFSIKLSPEPEIYQI